MRLNDFIVFENGWMFVFCFMKKKEIILGWYLQPLTAANEPEEASSNKEIHQSIESTRLHYMLSAFVLID